MRIIIFTGYYLPRIGGSVNHIHQIAKRLVDVGYHVDLVTLNSEKKDDFECLDGIHIYRLPSFGVIHDYEVPVPTIKTIKTIISLFNNNHDIVLTYTRFHLTSMLGLCFSKIKRIPYIHTELGSSHSVLSNRFLALFSATVDHTVGALIVTNASKIICNCKAGESFVKHLGAKKEVLIFPSGVDFSVFDRSDDQPTGLKNEDRRSENIAIISRLIYAKGVQDFLAAFPKIQAQIPGVKAYIIGDGPYRSQLEKSVDEDQKNNIIFTGSLSQKEIAERLRYIDVIINPSYSESLTSYSVLEGGAMGVPSISTDVGGVREVIEDGVNGLLVPPRNPNAIAEKTCLILRNPTFKESLGMNIFHFVKTNCDWDKIAKQHLTIFDSIEDA